MTIPGYKGSSQAIHVAADGPSVAIEAVPPATTAPSYVGSKAIKVVATSPDGFDLDSIRGPIYHNPHLHGRSEAIHVFGAVGFRDPAVVPACECTGEAGKGITDMFTRYGSHSVFDHPGGFNALEYGNFIGTSDAGVPWQVALYNTDESANVGVSVDGAEWLNSIEVPTNGREAFIYAYLQTPSPVPNQLGTTKKFQFRLVTVPTSDVTLRIIFDSVGVGFGSGVGNTLGAGGNEHVGSAGRGAAFLQVSKFATLNPSQMGFTLVDWSYLGGGSGSLNVPTTIPTSFWRAGVRYTFSIVTRVDYPTVGTDTVTSTVSDGVQSYVSTCAFHSIKTSGNDPVYRNPIYQPGIAFQRSFSFVATDPWVVAVDDVDIPELRATVIPSHVIDDFDRDTSGLGIASSGQEWAFVDASDNFDAVTSGTTLPYGRATPNLPPGIVGYYYVEADSEEDTAFVSHDLPSGGSEVWEEAQGFTMTGVFSAYNLPGTFLHSTIEVSLVDAGGLSHGDMRINMDTRQAGESGATEPGSLGVEGVAFPKTDWLTEADGKAYWWKWQRVPGPRGVSRLKVWVVGDAEPSDWGVTLQAPAVPIPAVPPGASLRLYVAAGQGPSPYLDFDSVEIWRIAIDGETCRACSCVEDGPAAVADSFTGRSMSVSVPSNTYRYLPMGTSASGHAWVGTGSLPDLPSLEVSGVGSTGLAEIADGVFHLSASAIDFFYFDGALLDLPLPTGTFDATWKMKIGTATSSGSQESFYFQGFAPFPGDQVTSVVHWSGTTINLGNTVGGGESLSATAVNPIPDGTWFHAHFQRIDDSVLRVRVWADGDPEPSTWTVALDISVASVNWPTNYGPGMPDLQMVLEGAGDPTSTGEYWVDDLNVYPNGAGSGQVGCGVAFVANFLPTFRYQIGDPTTRLDSFICTMESGAMALDWQTRGGVSVWGGELIPYCGRTEEQIRSIPGTNLGNVKTAWQHWGQHFDIRSGHTWDDLQRCLSQGRAVVLQGDYGVLPNDDKCQVSFEGNHAILLLPFSSGTKILVGDPLCHAFHGREASHLQAYAEALGAATYGAQSPQPILFGVSSPWVK